MCEPEAPAAPPPPEPPATNSQLSSFYNTAPCLPPYTAYDVQVRARTPGSRLSLFFPHPVPRLYLTPFSVNAPYFPQGSSTFPDSSGMSDESQSGASHMWPAMVPPRYSPPHFPPDEKPPPYSP